MTQGRAAHRAARRSKGYCPVFWGRRPFLAVFGPACVSGPRLTAAGVVPRVIMDILGTARSASRWLCTAHVVHDTQREGISHMDRLLRGRLPSAREATAVKSPGPRSVSSFWLVPRKDSNLRHPLQERGWAITGLTCGRPALNGVGGASACEPRSVSAEVTEVHGAITQSPGMGNGRPRLLYFAAVRVASPPRSGHEPHAAADAHSQ